MKVSKSESGFTLIEVLVTSVVIAIATVAIVEVFISVDRLNRQSRNLADATQIAQQKIESYRNIAYSNIPASENFTSSLPATLAAPRSATASFHDLSPAIPGLKQLDIVIYYTDGRARRDVQVTTMISQRGLSR
jgi:prepilin-type N-terminal cleavage/methylation domain-containing protein